jgi:hypothetical protein
MFRGESMRIRCIASQSNPTTERIGYSWTKNNALFHSDPQFEMWEDLYPDGSILTIQNIHKSATYVCTLSNTLASVSASIHVNIVDLELMSICRENLSYGIKWPATTSGPPVLHDCPIGYNGIAQRYCEQQDYNKSEWLVPDFADCINQKLLRISNEVRVIPFMDTFIYFKGRNFYALKEFLCLSFLFVKSFFFFFAFLLVHSSLLFKRLWTVSLG